MRSRYLALNEKSLSLSHCIGHPLFVFIELVWRNYVNGLNTNRHFFTYRILLGIAR